MGSLKATPGKSEISPKKEGASGSGIQKFWQFPKLYKLLLQLYKTPASLHCYFRITQNNQIKCNIPMK